MDWYIYELGNGVRSNNWKEADKVVEMMNVYQQAKAKVPAIDNRKVKAELLYNQLDLFFWCRLAYLFWVVSYFSLPAERLLQTLNGEEKLAVF